MDLGTALSDLSAPRPHYRFRTMLSLAKELAAEVRTFGAALLEALRNGDAEGLAELRADHESRVLERTRAVHRLRIDEQDGAKEALEASRQHARLREAYYAGLIEKGELEEEIEAQEALGFAAEVTRHASSFDQIAGFLHLIPTFSVGWAGPAPSTSISFGGSNVAPGFSGGATMLRNAASFHSLAASVLDKTAAWTRKEDQWKHERELAKQDQVRIDKEIAAANLRKRVVEQELTDLEFRIDRSREVHAYLQGRYTNAELYRWMSGEISRSYSLAYQLAYDVAKQAERCYRYELGTTGERFIEVGYWDNQRKGLFAGDRLLHDIRRMETAFLRNNEREYELTKRVSLAQLDPIALLQLREHGSCAFTLPEAIFELDHASHYMRRLRAVRVTFAAVTGPFSDVNGTLTRTRSEVRTAATSYDDPEQPVTDVTTATRSVALSAGESDSGVFETSRQDGRYLPFEGKGAANSHWHLSLPMPLRRFDYRSLTDVVLELRYTAREGGGAFAAQVLGEDGESLRARLEGLPHAPGALFGDGGMRAFSTRRDFPVAWDRFVAPDEGDPPRLEIELPTARHPTELGGPGLVVRGAILLLRAASVGNAQWTFELPSGGVVGEVPMGALSSLPGFFVAEAELSPEVSPVGRWVFTADALEATEVSDLVVLLLYGRNG